LERILGDFAGCQRRRSRSARARLSGIGSVAMIFGFLLKTV